MPDEKHVDTTGENMRKNGSLPARTKCECGALCIVSDFNGMLLCVECDGDQI